jgi:hypothetical protein
MKSHPLPARRRRLRAAEYGAFDAKVLILRFFIRRL